MGFYPTNIPGTIINSDLLIIIITPTILPVLINPTILNPPIKLSNFIIRAQLTILLI